MRGTKPGACAPGVLHRRHSPRDRRVAPGAPGSSPAAFEQRGNRREPRCSGVVGALLAGALVLTAPVFAQSRSPGPERFEGRIANTGTFGNAGSNFFSVQVDEYTSDEEFIEFLEILAGGGPRRLEDAFLRSRKGRIVINSLGYDIALARSAPTESGRVVRVFTVRHLGFDESVGRTPEPRVSLRDDRAPARPQRPGRRRAGRGGQASTEPGGKARGRDVQRDVRDAGVSAAERGGEVTVASTRFQP